MSFLGIEPYLYYPDKAAALDWLERVFGFGPSRRVAGDDGVVQEGDIAIGPARVSVGGNDGAGGRGLLLIAHTDDLHGVHERIQREHDQPVDPPKREDYGPLSIHLTDPWGYSWYFWEGEATYPEDSTEQG